MVDRYQVQMFRRVTKVSLWGRQYKRDLLPQLAKFKGLRELDLYETSIPRSDLEAWKREHPRVTVRATQNGKTL